MSVTCAPATYSAAPFLDACRGGAEVAAAQRDPVHCQDGTTSRVQESEGRRRCRAHDDDLAALDVGTNRQGAGDGGQSVGALRVVVDGGQHIGARRESNRVLGLAVRVRRVDRRDQARHVAAGTVERTGVCRAREAEHYAREQYSQTNSRHLRSSKWGSSKSVAGQGASQRCRAVRSSGRAARPGPSRCPSNATSCHRSPRRRARRRPEIRRAVAAARMHVVPQCFQIGPDRPRRQVVVHDRGRRRQSRPTRRRARPRRVVGADDNPAAARPAPPVGVRAQDVEHTLVPKVRGAVAASRVDAVPQRLQVGPNCP